jgi:hypothetical protein
MVFHDYLGIRRAPSAVKRMRDVRLGDLRRGRLRYSYNAGGAGVVDKQLGCGILVTGHQTTRFRLYILLNLPKIYDDLA